MDEDIYSLEELIEALEDIKNNGDGPLNFPKAFYSLVKEIEKLKEYQNFLHDLIPLKYKKAFPRENENPFFSLKDFKLPENKQELENAKKRMESFLQNSKQDFSADALISSEE